jgi:cytochrome c
MNRDGKPDTNNVACMKNCAAQVRLTSEMPDHARDQHGNAGEQSRMFAAVPATAARKSGLDAARAFACTACHGVSERAVGPAFREIARRYSGDGTAETGLVAKVKAGGTGNWGSIPMPAQGQLQDADVRALVQWILAGAN